MPLRTALRGGALREAASSTAVPSRPRDRDRRHRRSTTRPLLTAAELSDTASNLSTYGCNSGNPGFAKGSRSLRLNRLQVVDESFNLGLGRHLCFRLASLSALMLLAKIFTPDRHDAIAVS